MFFDGWDDLVRLVVIGVLSYVGLVVILRATGKRTLSKMNAFDLVITVALGSTLSSALLSQDVSLSEGLLAFVLLCALQYGVTFLSVRSDAVQGFVKAEPSLLYFKGRYLDRHLKRERVTREEIWQPCGRAGRDRWAMSRPWCWRPTDRFRWSERWGTIRAPWTPLRRWRSNRGREGCPLMRMPSAGGAAPCPVRCA